MNYRHAVKTFLLSLGLLLFLGGQATAQTLVDLAVDDATLITSLTPSDIQLTQGATQGLASGDLDGDGVTDLVIGAAGRNESTIPPVNGEVFVIFGPIDADRDLTDPADVDLTITGADAGDLFGWTSLVADLDGDGDDDLAVAAIQGDGPSDTRADAGEVHIFFGPLQAGTLLLSSGDADLTIYGVEAGDVFGYATAAEDLSGDGALDLIIGSPSSADEIADPGSTHVLFGPLSAGSLDLATTAADITVTGVDGDLLGFAVAAGDVSGDGKSDLILGAPSTAGGGVIQGRVHALFGPFSSSTSVDLSTTAGDLSMTGPVNAFRLGTAVSSADLDGDGEEDLIAASRFGSAHALFGPISSGTALLADATDLSVYLPDSVLVDGVFSLLASDISGDGHDDLVLGAFAGDGPTNNRIVAGEVHALFGPLAPGVIDLEQTPADLTVLGANAGDQIGRGMTVANIAGDLSPDLVLEASFAGPSTGNRGEVFILEGPLRDCFIQDDFDDGLLDPAWTLVGVGNANQESVLEQNGELELTADGATAFYGRDNAGFLYRSVTGDFRMETTIDGNPMSTGGIYRKAGLMVRASLDDYDIRLLAQLAPFWNDQDSTRLQFAAREFYGQPGNIAVATEVLGVPRVVRLAIERVGQELTVEYSLDGGASWIRPTTGLGGSITIANLPPTLLVGLDMVSNNISVTSTAHFDDFLICTP